MKCLTIISWPIIWNAQMNVKMSHMLHLNKTFLHVSKLSLALLVNFVTLMMIFVATCIVPFKQGWYHDHSINMDIISIMKTTVTIIDIRNIHLTKSHHILQQIDCRSFIKFNKWHKCKKYAKYGSSIMKCWLGCWHIGGWHRGACTRSSLLDINFSLGVCLERGLW